MSSEDLRKSKLKKTYENQNLTYKIAYHKILNSENENYGHVILATAFLIGEKLPELENLMM